MIADIGTLIACYIIFRCIMELMHLEKDGSNGKLNLVSQVVIFMLTITMVILSAGIIYSLKTTSQQAADTMRSLQSQPLPSFPESTPSD